MRRLLQGRQSHDKTNQNQNDEIIHHRERNKLKKKKREKQFYVLIQPPKFVLMGYQFLWPFIVAYGPFNPDEPRPHEVWFDIHMVDDPLNLSNPYAAPAVPHGEWTYFVFRQEIRHVIHPGNLHYFEIYHKEVPGLGIRECKTETFRLCDVNLLLSDEESELYPNLSVDQHRLKLTPRKIQVLRDSSRNSGQSYPCFRTSCRHRGLTKPAGRNGITSLIDRLHLEMIILPHRAFLIYIFNSQIQSFLSVVHTIRCWWTRPRSFMSSHMTPDRTYRPAINPFRAQRPHRPNIRSIIFKRRRTLSRMTIFREESMEWIIYKLFLCIS